MLILPCLSLKPFGLSYARTRACAVIGKARELKNAAAAKAVLTLTSEQKKVWKDMNGEPFDFNLELPVRLGRRP